MTNPTKPQIDVNQPRINFVQEVFSHLKSTERFYLCGESLVYIDRQDQTIKTLGRSDLEITLSGEIDWVKQGRQKDKLESVHLPPHHSKLLYETTFRRPLHTISGFAHHPLVDENGQCSRIQSGYDAKTKVFSLFNECQYQSLGWSTLSLDAAAQAAKFLSEDLFADFPGQTPADQSKILCAAMTAVLRPLLPTAPMFVVTAQGAGSGKSLLCDLLSTLACGQVSPASAYPTSPEEADRQLISILRYGPAIVNYDNVVGELIETPPICSCLTQSTYAGRLLGSNQMLTVNTSSLFLASGNFLTVCGDLRRRSVVIRLSTQKRLDRSFRHLDLLAYARQKRPDLVMMLQKIAAGFMQTGTQIDTKTLIPSYSRWDLYCRQPLLRLGYPDPADDIREAMSTPDPAALARMGLVEQLLAHFPEKAFGVADVIPIAPDLRDVLPKTCFDPGGQVNRTALGMTIANLAKQPPEGYRIEMRRKTPSALYVISAVDSE